MAIFGLGSQVEQIQEAIKVYNLEIEDSHTYYVSDKEVLVHNDCHKAEYELLDNKGEVVVSGTVVSGGTNPGRRLSWVEQLETHTEVKIINILKDIIKEGVCINILYFMEGDDEPWVFPQ